jgi:cyclopropane fatty-acyl-phospholipid synthase-like methyltransferase/DUF1365 family protein
VVSGGAADLRPGRYRVTISHRRRDGVDYRLQTRSRAWLVDVDRLPRLPGPLARLCRFEVRDHLDGRPISLRSKVEQVLLDAGADRPARVFMLAQPRSFGYVFDPLTLFYCLDTAGRPAHVVAEVRNTYHERHAYLLTPDAAGRSHTDKAFYVSPFHPVDGSYDLYTPLPGDRLAVQVTLRRPGAAPFTAAMTGERHAGDSLWPALASPLSSRAVMAAIRRHGITLFLKGLRPVPRPGRPARAGQLAALVAPVTGGQLPVRLQAWDGSAAGPAGAPLVQVRSPLALRRLLWHPNELGLAQAYVSGEIDVPDGADALGTALRRAWQLAGARGRASGRSRVRAAVSAARLGALGPRPAPPACQARPRGRLHTRARDRAVIAHHYDLSNEFYALVLDESMAYSCGYYPRAGMSLADAQRAKLDLICRKLQLRPGQRLLDVGCGWGALILHAAEHHGVTALGITLSAQQHRYVRDRIAERGLEDHVQVQVRDYREVAEPCDAIASIEMGEHVGRANYPTYVGALFAQLRPGGRLLLQQMSRAADAAPGGGAFIENFIAPDMHMRPAPATAQLLRRAGFELCDVQPMGEHYARTVGDWLDRFEGNFAQAVELVGEEAARAWRLYLVGGRLAFEQGRMGVEQFLAVRPDALR